MTVITFTGGQTGSSSDALGFYSTREASRLARVPIRRLYAWKREGIIRPVLTVRDSEGREEIGYTFHEVVYLRVLRLLRDKGMPLFRAVWIVKHLRERFGPPGPKWEDVRIFTQGEDFFVESKDKWEVTEASTRHGQKVAVLLMGGEFAALRDRADALLVPERFRPFVMVDPATRSGMPTIKDTTIETSVIYRLRARHVAPTRVREYYPMLSLEQIRNAVSFEKFLDSEAP